MRAGLWLIAVILVNSATWGQAFSGMDRNDYRGDTMLGALHKSPSYTSYWLNAPPGGKSSTWTGKRVAQGRDFGFLLLWNARLDRELKGKDAASLARSDAVAASREGF